MITLNYNKKSDILIGSILDYTETSVFGKEVKGLGIEKIVGSNRRVSGGLEFYAEITLKDGIIIGVK